LGVAVGRNAISIGNEASSTLRLTDFKPLACLVLRRPDAAAAGNNEENESHRLFLFEEKLCLSLSSLKSGLTRGIPFTITEATGATALRGRPCGRRFFYFWLKKLNEDWMLCTSGFQFFLSLSRALFSAAACTPSALGPHVGGLLKAPAELTH
jgi:hypothetical protein